MPQRKAPRSPSRPSWLRRHRVDVATGLVAVMGVTSLIVYAALSQGNPPHHAQLNDDAVWVSTNTVSGQAASEFGQINADTGRYTASVLASKPQDRVDVLQDGLGVLGWDQVDSTLTQINPVTGLLGGASVALPADAKPVMGGNDQTGTLAVLLKSSGRIYGIRYDATAVPDLSTFTAKGKGLTSAPIGAGGDIAVGDDGSIYVASPAGGLTVFTPAKGNSWTVTKTALATGGGTRLTVTAVGSTPVVMVAAESGRSATIVLPGNKRAQVPNADGAVLQQPSTDNSVVYVETSSALYAVNISTAGVSQVPGIHAGGVTGAPVFLRSCVFAAWASGGQALANQRCDSGTVYAQALTPESGTEFSAVEYHVNHNTLLLNDPTNGPVFTVLGTPKSVDQWDKVRIKQSSGPTNPNDSGDLNRKPPTANPDVMGVRAGTAQSPYTTRLFVLDNDSGAGHVLSIDKVSAASSPGASVAVAPDRQSVLATVSSPDVQSFTFTYTDSNGNAANALSKPAKVTVNVVPAGKYEVPQVRQHPNQELPDLGIWNVPVNGTLSIPVLNDWRNYGSDSSSDFGTGDPVALDPLTLGAVQRGHAISTSDGTVEYQAPNGAGPDTITYRVSDGTSQSKPQQLTINVIAASKPGTPPVANSDYARGVVNVPFTFNPLLNDIPGADPADPNAQLQLHGSIQSADPKLKVVSQSSDGTLTLLGSAVGPYTVDYTASYGTKVSKSATIRVDIDPSTASASIQTAPDTVTVHGVEPGLSDVLVNDFDPRGQLLTVVGSSVADGTNLTAAVVEGRWIRVSETRAVTSPTVETVLYRVSDGVDDTVVTGQLTVNELPQLDAPSPIVETDYATVRQGDEVSVPVLDNDATQDGSALTLEQDFRPTATSTLAHGQLPVAFVGHATGNPGQAFVAGNLVRFTAPLVPAIKTNQQVVVTYQVLANDGSAQTGSVFVTITPPGTPQNDRAPVPQDVQARVVAGGTTTIALPTSGVDPDGDTVQVIGLAPNDDGTVGPKLGQIQSIGANSMTYQAFPSATNGGTDTFRYTVVDTYGVTATAAIRVSVVQPTVLPDPVPHAISATAAPGTAIVLKVVSPAHIDFPEGDAPTLVDPAQTNQGSGYDVSYAPGDDTSIRVVVPEHGKSVINLAYQITGESGLVVAQGITIHVSPNYVAPPIAIDQFAHVESGATEVKVPLLHGDISQSGGQLHVIAPASAAGGTLTVALTAQPQVIPYVIADTNGGEATAVVYVPAGQDNGTPFWNGTPIKIPTPGSPFRVDITKYVKNPTGKAFHLTTTDEVWPAPVSLLDFKVTGNTSFTLTSKKDGSGNLYQGPAAVTFPVTTSNNLNAVTYITVPVIVGNPAPVLRCPQDQIPVVQGFTSNPVDIAAECHVWTVDGDSSKLKFGLTAVHAAAGISVATSDVHEPSVKATSNAVVGSTASLAVSVTGIHGPTSQIGVVVRAAPPLSIASIPVQTVTSGAATVINLKPYFTSPFGIAAVQFANKPSTASTVAVATSGQWGISVTPKTQADLTAAISFTIKDNNQSARNKTGVLLLQVLDVPSPPLNVVPRPEYDDHIVKIDWVASQPRGAGPVTYVVQYKLAAGGAWSADVAAGTSTSFDVQVPTNGVKYVFRVRGCNGVKTPGADGCGPWSSTSPSGTADTLPGPVTALTATIPPGKGSTATTGSLILTWVPPADHSSATGWEYLVSWPGGSLPPITDRTATTATISGLPNDSPLLITVATKNEVNDPNGVPPAAATTPGESAGLPPNPTWNATEPFTATNTADGTSRVVTLHWNAVDPNGPSPTYYTVSRTDSKGTPSKVVCSLIHDTTTCDDGDNIQNDGTEYYYSIVASNQADQLPGRTGDFESGSVAAPAMQASDDPQGVSNLTAGPTGQDGTAKLTFDLGASNGATSFVQCTVNGATCAGSPWLGFDRAGQSGITEIVTGLTNGSNSTFVLTACNNNNTTTQHDKYSGNPCKQAPGISTVTYGQFGQPTVNISVSGNVVSWNASGNADGRSVSVHVTDAQGAYNQTFTPEGPTSWSIATQQFTLPPSTSDTVTAVVSDTGSTPTLRTPQSATSVGVTTAPLSIPSGPSCSVSGTTLNCNWGAAQDKGTVTYHYSSAAGSGTTTATSVSIGGLPRDNTSHTFSVYATDTLGAGHTSGTVSTGYTDPVLLPTVTVTKGAKCVANVTCVPGIGQACTTSDCYYIHVTTANFSAAVSCTYDNSGYNIPAENWGANESRDSDWWNGIAGYNVQVTCKNGTQSVTGYSNGW